MKLSALLVLAAGAGPSGVVAAALGREALPHPLLHRRRHRRSSMLAEGSVPAQVPDEYTKIPTLNTALDPDAKYLVDLGPADKLDLEPTSPRATPEWRRRREKIAALLWLEDRLKELRHSLDEKAYSKKILEAQLELAADAKVPATAMMLARMREQMHDFAAPLFREAVDDELTAVKAKHKALLQELINDSPTPKPLQVEVAADVASPSSTPPPKSFAKVSGHVGGLILGISLLVAAFNA
mmetsp:Transcript_84333/g.243804  ORF Transcript_84333/g.243804 Transcript_84333/m.243804 type:complete len:240 (+) Transcript_84333:78-797(+)